MKRTLNKITFLIVIIFTIISNQLYSQTDTTHYYPGLLWVTVADPSAKPISSTSIITPNSGLNQLFTNYNVTSYKQVMPYAKTPQLRNVYALKFKGDDDVFMGQLSSAYGNLFSNIEKRAKAIILYDPADWMWYAYTSGQNNWMWYLGITQANYAWDITRGDPNLKIAIIDDGVDTTHPDVSGKVNPDTDFYYGGAFAVAAHGTSVVSLLAGETCDQGQSCIGPGETTAAIQPSMGYKCRVMFSSDMSSDVCLYASTVMGAKIISISWYNWGYYGCNPDSTDVQIEREILNNGTSIFRAAGNNGADTGSLDCGGGRLYPFSGHEDSRTIVVSGTDYNDNHADINPGTVPTVSQYPEVSICAPCYSLVSADPGSPTFPYYAWGGTSQSTPIAAGVGALMLSVDPNLSPTNVKSIIQQTADPITDAANYPGLVGAGRINAFKAVCYTYNNYPLTLSNTTVSGTNTYTRNKITITNTTLAANSKVAIKTGYLKINGPFKASAGGYLTISNYTCN